MNELLVTLSGPMGSGKSTVAKGLTEEHSFHIISIGSTIKKVSTMLIDEPKELLDYLRHVLTGESEENLNAFYQQLLDGFHEKFPHPTWKKDEQGAYIKTEDYRELTQYVATYFRTSYSEDIWVRFIASDAVELAAKGEKVICDDMRFPTEKRILEMFGFTSIRLDISDAVQKKRLEATYGTISDELRNHPGEHALDDAHFDLHVNVDTLSIEETRNQVYAYLGLI